MAWATCVIYNPVAGRGRALRLLEEFQRQTSQELELRPTKGPGHAVELARAAAADGFEKVVAAGGDGTVHEVANGLLQTQRRDVVLSVWPIGSANDFAHSVGMDRWWARRHERLPTQVLHIDIGRVTVPGRERYMVCCCGAGFNGMVTVESRKTNWLAGLPLYAWAFVKAMVRHFTTPTMTISFDGQVVTSPTLSISILNGQREGNFPICPEADLTDGLLDYLHATRLTRGNLLRYLPLLALGRLPRNNRLLRFGRARSVRVTSEAALCAHADGEFVSLPEEGIRELSVELVPQRLPVEVCYPLPNRTSGGIKGT
jgi:diacylglycerol kinase (ATP)